MLKYPRNSAYLPTFESAVGGDDPPHWIAVGGHSAQRPFPHTFVLFLTISNYICPIHRIIMKGKQAIYIKIVFIYTKIKKYICI